MQDTIQISLDYKGLYSKRESVCTMGENRVDTQTLKAYAKINLTLDVVNRRSNGYHDVQMIMQQIDLYDEVTVEKTDAGIAVETNCAFIPCDAQNIAWRAADLFLKTYEIQQGVRISIQKNIPVAAGLAGGSTNAAAVLRACNSLFEIHASVEDLKALGLKLGADVPFCIEGGAALAEGIGENLTRIRGLKDGYLVVCKPNFGVSTREIYENLQWDRIERHPDTAAMLRALGGDDLSEICNQLVNVLEEVTLVRYPEVKVLKERMQEYGARGVLMSGSGPTVFGIFRQGDKARRACENLKRYYRQAYVVKPVEAMGDEV